MPTLPIIEDVFRCTFNLTSVVSPPVHNVWHVRSNPGISAPAVGAAVSSALANANVDNLFQCLPNSFTLSSVDILPLDGVSAAYVQSPGVSWPAGLQAGDTIYELGVLITLRTERRGPRGRGRQFVGPITESVVNGISPTSTMITTMQAAWENFRLNLTGHVDLDGMVIASYVHSSAELVTQAIARPTVGLQTRRMTRLR